MLILDVHHRFIFLEEQIPHLAVLGRHSQDLP
jgi:hypothetical protein